jgi:CheY-like chemotaxis protein
MQGTSLAGHSILIVEDEPLIALDIVAAFQNAGANPLTARSLAEAVRLVEHDGPSAAVLDAPVPKPSASCHARHDNCGVAPLIRP